MKVGDKIKFAGEKQRYTVRAYSEPYAICTKPFNLKKTVLYTIVDFKEGIRGTENLIFGMGAETDRDCMRMLRRIKNCDSKISHRNRVELEIEDE